MTILLKSWTSPKTIKGKPSNLDGRGFFALENISKGEILAIKGGHIIDRATYLANKNIIKDSEAAIADGFYIAPLTAEEFEESMVFINHSCEPNSGFGGNIVVVAMRDINAGEELTIDYAMHQADPDYSMICNCKKPNCRHTVTGNDWKNPKLQHKYNGYFSWYIQQKINSGSNAVQ